MRMAEASAKQPKRRRRPRFNKAELVALVEGVEKRQDIIMVKNDHKSGATSQKAQAWQQVCDAVNCVSRLPRTVDEIRRKFIDLKNRVKSKACEEIRHTGGDSPVEIKFNDAERTLFRLMSLTSLAGLPRPDNGGLRLNGSAGPAEPPTNPAIDEEIDPLSITSEEAVMFIEEEELTLPITPASESTTTSARIPSAAAPPPAATPHAPSAAPPRSSSSFNPNSRSGGRQPAHPPDPTADFEAAYLSTQREIRDLLAELVQSHQSGVAAQREVAAAVREGAAALQDLARAQKDQNEAILALAKCCVPHQ
ncbi:uncharacterized protein LOC126988793 isoform X2 [Eriocheir sinensis]|uniref:uncharacterized protein LOC126988793 isoform X2 n=1 Tax=Eriocheir sinensis TaxID=95602 RepID=UPI0021CA0E7C|nr:uncharacterized protein LOC126988793 isoform X2 [Eriocheir sinensis]